MGRTYSTREVSRMWNVSESTIKRWANSGQLSCRRTPGGHRRFSLHDLQLFQKRRRFEATGALDEEESADLERLLNERDITGIRRELLRAALRNQRHSLVKLLERLLLRGIGLVDLYDQILLPVIGSDTERTPELLTPGHLKLALNNLEEAICHLFPEALAKAPNGKLGLCASPGQPEHLLINGLARILESAGWECFNLGTGVSFSCMAEMVKLEPVNLVCLCQEKSLHTKKAASLLEVVQDYRIPLLHFSCRLKLSDPKGESYATHFNDFASLYKHLAALAREDIF